MISPPACVTAFFDSGYSTSIRVHPNNHPPSYPCVL